MKCEDCRSFYSCNYMKHRFNVKECEEHDIQVIIKYTLELMERELIVVGGK